MTSSDNPTQPKFYNLYYSNNTTSSQVLTMEQSLNIPILRKPSDYDVSIVRFNLPGYNIPYFKFPTYDPLIDARDLRLKLSLSYNGIESQQPVTFDQTLQSSDGYIWEIQAFITMLNQTIQYSYQSLNALVTLPNTYTTVTPTFTTGTNIFTLAGHGLTNGQSFILLSLLGSLQTGVYFVINSTVNTFQLSTTIYGTAIIGDTTGTIIGSVVDLPYFTYSEINQLISFTANENYYLNTLSNPIRLSINTTLLTYLQGFTIHVDSSLLSSYIILVMNTNNNITAQYVKMTQAGFYFSNWLDFDSIIITTNLPIANEYQGSATALPILSDFVPSNVTISNFHDPIIYNPVTPFRQYPLISDSPIYDIKCYCYLSTTNGELRQIFVGPGRSANIKLMFTPKKTNKYA